MVEFTPFLRVQLYKPHSDVQCVIKETEGFVQLVPKKEDYRTLFVRYEDASCAQNAAKKLKNDPNIPYVGPMPKWNFFKTPVKQSDSGRSQPDCENAMPGTRRPPASPRLDSPQRQNPQRPMPQARCTNAPQAETSPDFMRCSYCSGFPVPFQCGACGTFYCNAWCQKRHYETHKHSCRMPPLIVMEDYYEVNLLEKMRPNMPDFPNVSANGQQPASNNMPKRMQAPPHMANFSHASANGHQPASNNMPKGMPEKMNVKTTPPQKKQVAPSTPVTTGTGAGTGPSNNKMPQGSVATLPAKAKATPLPPNREKAETKPVPNSTARQTSQKAEEGSKTALRLADFPAVGDTVKISFVGKNELYIYGAGPGPNGRPNSHIQLIRRCLEEGRKKGNTLTKAPVVGDILLAPFSGEYYRAVVNSVEGKGANVFFVDFGNSEQLEWAEFKTILEPDLKYADRIAHEVWIANVSKFTEPIRVQLNELEAEEFELSNVIDMSNTSVKLVELRHPTELYYLSDKLRQLHKKDEEVCKPAEMQKVVVAPVPETYVPVLDDEIIETSIPAENGVELIIIDASYVQHSFSQISVLVKANHQKYGELMKEIHRYGEADTNEFKPRECGELCLVYFESVWTRAMSTDVQSDTGDYMLFDLGILCSVPLKNVRRFPPKLSRTLYVTDCIVDNPETLFTLANGSTAENLRTKQITVNVKPDRDSGDSQHVTVIDVAH
ncbi:uncharacterized protein LOC128272319 [Anopheles cruzii]|uniref:uncharacterized protein LOC128272319 n=1 Tax=Anopheles cruzii TaxID=68878 RepID=UPI0022EC2D19|nr:uncharacterized protein LOC128272319 [Anopheles cruzii]